MAGRSRLSPAIPPHCRQLGAQSQSSRRADQLTDMRLSQVIAVIVHRSLAISPSLRAGSSAGSRPLSASFREVSGRQTTSHERTDARVARILPRGNRLTSEPRGGRRPPSAPGCRREVARASRSDEQRDGGLFALRPGNAPARRRNHPSPADDRFRGAASPQVRVSGPRTGGPLLLCRRAPGLLLRREEREDHMTHAGAVREPRTRSGGGFGRGYLDTDIERSRIKESCDDQVG